MTVLSKSTLVGNVSRANFNYRFFDLIDIIKKAELHIINDLHLFDLLSDKISYKNSDIKKIIYHHIVYTLCEFIINSQYTEKYIFVISPKSFNTNTLRSYEYTCKDELQNAFMIIFKKISNILPINIFLDLCFCDVRSMFKLSGGEWLEESTSLINRLKDNFNYDFSKVKRFAKQYDLTFLLKEYFNNIKTKSILYK